MSTSTFESCEKFEILMMILWTNFARIGHQGLTCMD